MNNTHTCETCKWLTDEYTRVCWNDKSDRAADFVGADDTCPLWEEKRSEE